MQFSLKTLLWGTTYCAVACAVLTASFKAVNGEWHYWRHSERTALVAAALIPLAWWQVRIKADALVGVCLLAIGVQHSALAVVEATIASYMHINVCPPGNSYLSMVREHVILEVVINIAPPLCVLMPAVVGCIRRPARGTKLVAASMVLCVLSSALTILTVLEAIRCQDLLR